MVKFAPPLLKKFIKTAQKLLNTARIILYYVRVVFALMGHRIIYIYQS